MNSRIIFIFFFSALLSYGLSAQKIYSLSGVYKGENLWVQNPFLPKTQEFCVQQVRLNGKTILKDIKLSAFQIDMDMYLRSRNLYDPVRISLVHEEDCVPHVPNVEVISPDASFLFTSVFISADTLYWEVRDEAPKAEYLVERLQEVGRWEHQTRVPVDRIGMERSYFVIPEFKTGLNKFRIRYISPDQEDILSMFTETHYAAKEINFYPLPVKDKMTLSKKTYFEILNLKNEVLLKGDVRVIPLRRLPPGSYYIVLDGRKYPFVKR
ncbi:MAG: hypothetical protein OXB93_01475 [Cytophagales bacterium]|nr:hypothetical protein [Cytophagales bacterium]